MDRRFSFEALTGRRLHELLDQGNNPFMAPKKNVYLCAAYIAHPYLDLPRSLIGGNGTSQDILRILVGNKVLFRSFTQHDVATPLRKSSLVSCLLAESKEMSYYYEFYKIFRDELLTAIRLLNRYNIETLFIKSSSILPLDSDNFDLLIHPDQSKPAEYILRRNGFAKVNFSREPYKVLYRRVQNGKDHLALHLHTKIAWYGVEFLKTESVWKRHIIKAVNGESVGFIHPNHHVLVTLAHAFFENASLKLSDILFLVDDLYHKEAGFEQIIPLSEEMNWDTFFRAMMIFGNRVHNDIYGLDIIPSTQLKQAILDDLNRRELKKIERLRRRIELHYKPPYLPTELPLKKVRRRQLISQVISNKSKASGKMKGLSYLLSIFFKGILPKSKVGPSLLISIIGIDGVGKTTHALKLVNDFNQRGYKASHIWTRGTFRLTGPFLNFIRKLMEKSATNRSKENLEKDVVQTLARRGSFLRRALVVLLLLEHSIQLRSKLFLNRFSNNVTVCDRYIHDTLIDSLLHYGEKYNSSFSNSLSKMISLTAPKPSLLIMLKTNPDVLSKRRPKELSTKAMKLKLQAYKVWGAQWGAYMLDTKYSIEKNHLELLETVLRTFYEKNERSHLECYNNR